MAIEYIVVGIGSIGERHTRNLLELGISPEKIGLCDIDQSLLKKKEKSLGINNSSTKIAELLNKGAKATIICTPNKYHIEDAVKAVEAGSDVFIEKPISHSSEGVRDFLKKAEETKKIVMVGYCLRFDDALIKIKSLVEKNAIGKVYSMRAQFGQYLPDWHPYEDYRKMYSAKSDLGGGIVLDASHEIDYARWIIGDVKGIKAFCGKVSNLQIETEDIAEILLTHDKNEVTSLHLDYLYRGYLREGMIIGSDGNITWNLGRDETCVRLLSQNGDINEWNFKGALNKRYKAEMSHFLNCIKTREKPIVSGEDGLAVLKICEAVKKGG